jgi:hypothetical protein
MSLVLRVRDKGLGCRVRVGVRDRVRGMLRISVGLKVMIMVRVRAGVKKLPN